MHWVVFGGSFEFQVLSNRLSDFGDVGWSKFAFFRRFGHCLYTSLYVVHALCTQRHVTDNRKYFLSRWSIVACTLLICNNGMKLIVLILSSLLSKFVA